MKSVVIENGGSYTYSETTCELFQLIKMLNEADRDKVIGLIKDPSPDESAFAAVPR